MRHAKPVLACCLLVIAVATLTACGSSARDHFYSSRPIGISPVGDAPVSAALFRSDAAHTRP